MGTPIGGWIVSCLKWDHYGPSFSGETHQFECHQVMECTYEITDHELGIQKILLPVSRVINPKFNVVQWYAQQLKKIFVELALEFEQRKFQDDDSDDDNNSDNGHISKPTLPLESLDSTGQLPHIMHLHCPIQHGQMKLTISCATWPAEIGPSHGASPCHMNWLMVRCFTVPYWWLLERLSPSNIDGLTHWYTRSGYGLWQ